MLARLIAIALAPAYKFVAEVGDGGSGVAAALAATVDGSRSLNWILRP